MFLKHPHTDTKIAILIAKHKENAIAIAANIEKKHVLKYYRWVICGTQSQFSIFHCIEELFQLSFVLVFPLLTLNK